MVVKDIELVGEYTTMSVARVKQGLRLPSQLFSITAIMLALFGDRGKCVRHHWPKALCNGRTAVSQTRRLCPISPNPVSPNPETGFGETGRHQPFTAQS